MDYYMCCHYLKGPLLSLRQFMSTENALNVMKNAFYFVLEAFFVLKGTITLIEKALIIYNFAVIYP